MQWNGRWMRPRTGNELATLKVRQGALNGASGESGRRGDGLMRRAHGPVGLLGCLTIEVKVDDERALPPVMAYQVGQKAIEQVRVESYLCHRLL